jgi:hypothetical protein
VVVRGPQEEKKKVSANITIHPAAQPFQLLCLCVVLCVVYDAFLCVVCGVLCVVCCCVWWCGVECDDRLRIDIRSTVAVGSMYEMR